MLTNSSILNWHIWKNKQNNKVDDKFKIDIHLIEAYSHQLSVLSSLSNNFKRKDSTIDDVLKLLHYVIRIKQTHCDRDFF